jgi:lysozyme
MPHCNAAGLNIIKSDEGDLLTSYQDDNGIWTIGYGHTSGVGPNQTCTQAQADAWLAQDVQQAETAVADLVQIQLTPNQFSALVSWQYNTGGLARTPGLILINQRQFQAAWDDHLCLWLQPDPVGLALRRAQEKALFFTPTDPADAAGADPTGGAEEIP